MLIKLRTAFAEAKVNVNRLMTYLSIFNFVMILFIFLNTTLWEVTFFRELIPNKTLFMTFGLTLALICSIVIAVLDKRFVHGEEIARQLTIQRNPTICYECVKVAAAINIANKNNPDNPEVKWMTEWATHNFDRLGMKEYFERCLRAFGGV